MLDKYLRPQAIKGVSGRESMSDRRKKEEI